MNSGAVKHPKQLRDLILLNTHPGEGAAGKEIIQIKQDSKASCVIYFITLTPWHGGVWEQQQTLAVLREEQDYGELRGKGPLLTVGMSGFGWGQSKPPETGVSSWSELL